MTVKKRKSAAATGAVLHKIKDKTALKPWADYIASLEASQKQGLSAEKLIAEWSLAEKNWQFYSAVSPRDAKRNPDAPGFDNEEGLIIFSVNASLQEVSEKGGLIQALTTKRRHKILGKYLLTAAERVISDAHPIVYALVGADDASAQRLYKSLGYEEISRAGNEILVRKRLVT